MESEVGEGGEGQGIKEERDGKGKKKGGHTMTVMDPIKVQGVTDWLQPVEVKDVQSFIGFVNFYQRFICNFSKIAHPLHALTHKLKDWSWGAAEQQAFDALMSTVTSTPMLTFLSRSGPFHLECMHPTSPQVLSCHSNKRMGCSTP